MQKYIGYLVIADAALCQTGSTKRAQKHMYAKYFALVDIVDSEYIPVGVSVEVMVAGSRGRH